MPTATYWGNENGLIPRELKAAMEKKNRNQVLNPNLRGTLKNGEFTAKSNNKQQWRVPGVTMANKRRQLLAEHDSEWERIDGAPTAPSSDLYSYSTATATSDTFPCTAPSRQLSVVVTLVATFRIPASFS